MRLHQSVNRDAASRDRAEAADHGLTEPAYEVSSELAGFVPVARSRIRRQSGSHGGRTPQIRRQVLSKLVTNDPGHGEQMMVWDVVIGGRSPSPFTGTMGAHSTAWVAHLDAVRRHLVNLPLSQGADYLIDLARQSAEAPTSPLMALESEMPEAQRNLLETQRTRMLESATTLDGLIADGAEDAAVVSAVRDLIDGYLTHVNYLPTATVQGGDPRGHGEGVGRGLLNQFEYISALHHRSEKLTTVVGGPDTGPAEDEVEQNHLTQALTEIRASRSLFGTLLLAAENSQFDPVANPLLRSEIIQNLWKMFAAETPRAYFEQAPSALLKIWTAALKNFLHTVRLAYPYCYDFTRMHTPAAQWEGLQFAVAQAGETLSSPLREQLEQAITGRTPTDEPIGTPLDSDDAEIRGLDQYAEVADSDLVGGGTGLTVSTLMAGDVVGSIEMTGRTQSPFANTMGAHTTAWAATLDALRAQLIDRTVPAAIAALRQLSNDVLDDERLALSHLVDEKHQHRLAAAYTNLKAAAAQDLPVSHQAKIQHLESLVRTHLTYTNLLPMTTIESGGVPGGRNEGRARTFLLAFETNGDSEVPSGNKEHYVTNQLMALYDPGSLGNFAPHLDDREPPPQDHELTPRFQSTTPRPSAEELEAMAIREFHRTVSLAYPKAVAYIDWVLDADNPGLPGIPMDEDGPVEPPQARPKRKYQGDDKPGVKKSRGNNHVGDGP